VGIPELEPGRSSPAEKIQILEKEGKTTGTFLHFPARKLSPYITMAI